MENTEFQEIVWNIQIITVSLQRELFFGGVCVRLF